MFKVKVEGEYVTAGKYSQIERFEEEFELDEGRLSYARAIIQNGMIADRLRKQKKNFKHWRTCQVVDIVEVEGDSADSELEELLSKAADLGCMPANYNSYGDNELRKDKLKDAIKKKEARITKAKKKLDEQKKLDEEA